MKAPASNQTMMQTNSMKLRVTEYNILKKEERALHVLLQRYRKALHSLKLEELTLMRMIGESQDRDRQSRSSHGSRPLSAASGSPEAPHGASDRFVDEPSEFNVEIDTEDEDQ